MQNQTNKVPESETDTGLTCEFTFTDYYMKTKSEEHMISYISVLNQKHLCMYDMSLIHLNLTALLMK